MALSNDEQILWVGTTGGLEKWDNQTQILERVYSKIDGLPNNDVRSLLPDKNGGIWVGIDYTDFGNSGGLAYLSADNKLQIFSKENSLLPSNSVLSLVSDNNGGIWIGTDGGGVINLTYEKKWGKDYNKNNSDLPSNSVYDMLLGNDGGLWIGLGFDFTISDDILPLGEFKGGLAHISNDGQVSVYTASNSELPYDSVKSILSDGNGGIWVGTGHYELTGINLPMKYNAFGSLAHLLSNDLWEVYDTSLDGTISIPVNALITDDKGDLWIGSFGGLYHFSQGDFWFDTYYNLFEMFHTVTSLIEDSNGGIFVGTGDSTLDTFWVNQYQSGKKSAILYRSSDGYMNVYGNNTTSLPNSNIQSLLYDEKGSLWVGFRSGGFMRQLPDNQWIKYNVSGTVKTILSDGDGGVWLGSFGGGLIHIFADNTGLQYTTSNSSLPNDNVNVLEYDNKGDIWVGTYGGGFAHLSNDQFKVYNTSNSELPENNIQSLLSDGNGGVWVGTEFSYNTFAHMRNDESWELYNMGNSGLAGMQVDVLVSDASGGVWVGTSNGISHLLNNGTWELLYGHEIVYDQNGNPMMTTENNVEALVLDGQGGLWIGFRGEDGRLEHLYSDGTFEIYNTYNSALPNSNIIALTTDDAGGLWIGTEQGLCYIVMLGKPTQIKNSDPEVTLTWFLNRSPFDFQKVQYIELQRSLSKTGVYETVYDASGNPVRFHADYTNCPNSRADNCWPAVEKHTPAIKGQGDAKVKGYTLNTPITDPEWLEGIPRYYRLAAVIEEDDKLVIMAENREATLMAPAVEENPRVGLAVDRSAIAVSPGTETHLSLFVSSLDLFSGEVELAMESDITDDFDIKLDPASVSLNPGETKSLSLQFQVSPEVVDFEANVKIIAKTTDQNANQTAFLKVYAGNDPMVALSIAKTRTRPRVMDGITVSGNIIPARSEQEVIISGNNIEPLVLTTDQDGNFEGSLTPTKAGLLTLTALSNGATSTSEIFILPTRTHVALTSDVNQETSQGDTLRIQGIMTPVRLHETNINLDIRYLDPADPEAGLKPQFVGDVAIDENGVFYRDIVVPGDGFIHVTTSLSETSDYLGINTKLVIPIGQPVGEGIIVVSDSGTPEFQHISKSLGTYVYNALKNRNIPRERIRYLGLSDDDVVADGYADKNNLRHALTEWAVSLISTEDPYKTPLNLYLIGTVEEGTFRLNDNDVLTAEELAQYLDDAESFVFNNSDAGTKGFPVTIVLEGSQSEEWIEKISGDGRIVLTSSAAKPMDEGGYAGYDNLGESSFSRFFYQFINYGSDIEGSFAEANYEILKFYRHTQRPVMDADGDGVGTTKYDRYEASGKFIEYRPSGNLRPQIRTTNPDMTVNRKNGTTLWAIATDPETDMQGVFCSISNSSGNTVNMEMQHDRGDMYVAAFDPGDSGYSMGFHQLVFYAKDKAGNVSLPVEKFVNVVPDKPAPVNDSLEAPELTLSIEGRTVSISWFSASDATGYTLFYAPFPDAEYIGQFDMGMQGSIAFDGSGMAFYVGVKACNDMGCSNFSTIEYFNLK
ncbi:two-component regulator propeller domain-containing protein [Desulfamplus magnetovallimortis]|nr:two-component regulator propeller domain-containing protein [Desulfamplus magnetovallimortis]